MFYPCFIVDREITKKCGTEISHCHRLPSIHQSISCHVNSNTRGHSTHPCGTGAGGDVLPRRGLQAVTLRAPGP